MITEQAPPLNEPVKVVIFCPPSFQAEVLEQLAKVEAENVHPVTGQTWFTPSESAHPTTGEAGQTSFEAESKVEAFVDGRLVSQLRKSIEQSHPYESFAFEVYGRDEQEITHYPDKVKLRVKTLDPHGLMESLSELGAGQIGEYRDCFFEYPDEDDPTQTWVETICYASLLGEAVAQEGSFLVNGDKVTVEQFLENPVGVGRGA